MSSEPGGRRRGTLIVLSAPSGTGKSSIVKRLVAAVPDIVFSVSATTRAPRKGERDGVEYHFMDRERFLDLARRGEMLEHAEVHGNLYGTLRKATEESLSQGNDVLLEIDVQGAAQVAASTDSARLVFVMPPSAKELERRLRARATDGEDAVVLRLANAREEVARVGFFEFVIVNDEIDRAAQEMCGLVRAFRQTRLAQAERVGEILDSFGVSRAALEPAGRAP